MKRILITAPLDYELKGVRKLLQTRKLPFEIQTLTLGVGLKKSAKTLDNFLKTSLDWDLVIIIGLAGALDSSLKTGDRITPSFVSNGEETLKPKTQTPSLKTRAASFFTSNKILKPAEKKALREQNSSWEVVDMETFYLARTLEGRKMNYSVLRVVLDEENYVFPDFRWIFSSFRLKTKILFGGYFVFHPLKGTRVIGYRKKLKRALKALTQFTGEQLNDISN